MKTVILGKRSNLTNNLTKIIRNAIVISGEEISSNRFINKVPKEFNLIINIFYPTTRINNINNYEEFFEKNFILISKFLDQININRINKIIFSSSASIYGSINDINNNKNLYSISKYLIESYLQKITTSSKNKLIIARLYNIYDNNENFSIISKIIKNKKLNHNLIVNNSGESIRDFIHSEDVAKIYKILIKSNNFGVFEIGNGYGIKISNILKNIKSKKNLKYKNNISETKVSIANISKLKKVIKKFKFTSLEIFFKKNNIKVKNFFLKYSFDHSKSVQEFMDTTIIYGAGYSGKKLFEIIRKKSRKNLIYFIDDDKAKINKFYKNCPILSYEDLKKIYNKLNISNLIIAIPSLDNFSRIELINRAKEITENVSILPPKNEILNKIIDINDVQHLDLNNVFKRKISPINYKLLKYLEKSTILVTGAAGSIGSELVNQLNKINVKKIILYDNNETELFRTYNKLQSNKNLPILGDINDLNRLKIIIEKHKIDHIYHSAAYKHVNLLEKNPHCAVKNNIFGTYTVLKSINNKVKSFTLISTDKASNPKNNLGMTKRISEIISRNYINSYFKNLKLSIVRFGNVFASRGSVIEIFMDQINKNLPITITHRKAERYFMSIKEACNLVLQSVGISKKINGVYVLNMEKPVKIVKIAKEILNLFNKEKYPINFTGLKRGEKLSETLTNSKILKKTIHKDIFATTEMAYSNNKVKDFLSSIEESYIKNREAKTVLLMKKFLKKEIKKI